MPYPPKDGGSIATFQHVMGLANLNQNVTVLSLNTLKHYVDIKAIPKSVTDKVRFLTVDLDTSLSPISALKNLLFSNLPYNAERFISKEFEQLIIDTLSNNTYDIIQL